MHSLRSVLALGLLAGMVVLCTGAGIGDARSPASQPANWKVTDDASWIGPTSWQRRFTIPKFVETAYGADLKATTTKPAAAANRDYYAARSTRAVSSDAAGSTGASAKSTSTGKSEKSSSHSAHSSKSESRRSSRSKSDHGSKSSDRSRRRSERRSSRSSRD